jgi:photosystem II stability/assembly factor-like uncharacterized protein
MLRRSLFALWLLCFWVLAVPASAKDFVFLPAISVSDTASLPLLDIARAGDRLVAIGERGLVIVSDDEGESWLQAQVPVSATLTALSFATARKGWAVGHAGVILHTDDAGNSWKRQFDGNEANQQFLDYTNKQVEKIKGQINGLSMAGEAAVSGSSATVLADLEFQLEDAIFAQEDARFALDHGPADPFLDVLAMSVDTAIAVGAYGMIYRTENGGKTWHLSVAGIDNIGRYHYYAVARSEHGQMFLSGEAGLLYRSADNGFTWERFDEVYDGSLFGLVVVGHHVVAFGLRGNIFRSDDDGNTWSQWDNPNETSLYGGSVLADGGIVLLGSAGLVLLVDVQSSEIRALYDPSRTTFSAAVQGAGSQLLVVGMNGIQRVDTAREQADD